MKDLKLKLLMGVLLLFVVGACEKEEMDLLLEPDAPAFAQLKSAEVDIFTVDLLAGQDIDVGEVQVWNDAENLYVKYIVDEDGWCLTETHLQVSSSADFEPIPGQFEFKQEHECILDYTYEVPLKEEWDCDDVVIAAHAVVVKPEDDCWETVWQIGDVEVVNETTGWLENYADEFNWEDATATEAGLTLAQNVPDFTDPFIVGKTPTNEFPYNSNYNKGYAVDFGVQWEGELPFGGKLTISWSPGASGAEKKVISNDGAIDATFTATGKTEAGKYWFLDKYPLVENSTDVGILEDGVHTINFKHETGDGTFWDWIRLEKPCVQEETAWGDGERFYEKGNWATYFTYTINCCQEAIYLSDGTTNSGETTLNTVVLNGDAATITEIFDFSGVTNPGHFDYVNHIGVSPDGFIVYVVDEEEGYFGEYDVLSGKFNEIGQLSPYHPKGIVQVAVSPEGVVYVASKTSDKIYTVDLETLTLKEFLDPGVYIRGADMTFVPDGTLYLYTTYDSKLYPIDIGEKSVGTGVYISGKITGLATVPGTGTLLMSDTNANTIIKVNTDGTDRVEYAMDPFTHTWGDMASSLCGGN